MHADLAKRLWDAQRSARPVSPITASHPGFTLADGYGVQRAGREMARERGERIRGWKMGLTSRAKQRDVNVDAPIRGYLLESMEVEKGAAVPVSGRIHPRVEPELAVVLKRTPRGLSDVLAAAEGIYPALEILDSRFENFKFTLPDVVADNTSASGFLLGRHNYLESGDDLRLLGVLLRRNGVVEQTGAPAAVLGDPLLSVTALMRDLVAEGSALEPGMVILTGGITASVPFQAGDVVEVEWPGETLWFRAVK